MPCWSIYNDQFHILQRERTQAEKSKSEKSKTVLRLFSCRSMLSGDPQGYFIGAILYNIFFCNIPAPASGGLLLTYADDVRLVFSSLLLARSINRRTNEYLDALHRHCVRLRLKLDKVGREWNPLILRGFCRFERQARSRFLKGNEVRLGVVFQERLDRIPHLHQDLAKGLPF